jgi:hypothetical protein
VVTSPQLRAWLAKIWALLFCRKCLLEEHGTTSRVITACVPKTPTQGTKNGPRLDRWLLTDATPSRKRTLYQVEIKNWSATAIGGKELALDATPEIVRAYKRDRWLKHWDSEKGSFRYEYVAKVLSKMRFPTHMDDDSGRLCPILTAIQQDEVVPILCFWWAVHSDGEDEHVFAYPLPTGRYQRLWCSDGILHVQLSSFTDGERDRSGHASSFTTN